MYIFSRAARLGPGDLREQMGWATKVTEKVNQISEVPVRLWTTVFSPGVGTLVWSAVVENLASLESTTDKLMADDGYHTLLAEAAKYSSGEPIVDRLVRLIHADADVDPAHLEYVSVTTTMLAPGQTARGIELGVDIAQRAKAATKCPVSFGIEMTGPYNTVGWIGYYGSIQTLETAQEALGADASFAQLLDEEASQTYVVGSTLQTFARRVL